MSPAVPRASAPHRACPACQTTPPAPRAVAIAGASPARATASSSTAVDPAAEAPTTTAARRTLMTLTPRRRRSAQAVPALPSVLLVVRSDEGYGLTLFSHITFGAILFTQQKVQILNAETNVTSNILLLLFNTLFSLSPRLVLGEPFWHEPGVRGMPLQSRCEAGGMLWPLGLGSKWIRQVEDQIDCAITSDRKSSWGKPKELGCFVSSQSLGTGCCC